ncbi:aminopeptidase P family protein [Herbiconiux sp. L3-i23]|uniref:aminopeptidase P family protein n=1 Tax=Herbiconiux sp. L3-i23 TaxID=2905871 RepID=UPI002050473F|nr:aminopeptidase P family protein [Herbiconiux sp. L3-i23]BDI23459.1 Xaa-Pro aminopeptidase 1 [Herbiconiux sp. L3-i23]
MTNDAESPTEVTTPETSEEASRPANSNRAAPWPASFAGYIGSGWADRVDVAQPERPQSAFAAERRRRLSEAFPGRRLVIAAGDRAVRSNDTDFPFRADSAFSWLTGWASDAEPGSLLVLDPIGDGHTATLYFPPAAGRDTDEFYANPAVGEFWIGARPTLEQVAADLGLATADLAGFESGADDLDAAHDAILARTLSEFRLVKDSYEIEQMRIAVEATARGFDDIVADLPRIQQHARGERVIEGIFNTRARVEGNSVGYETIAASGPHACILHWTRNDGPVVAGDLVLIDAGVELDSLYTADITRTIPVDGHFTEVQRRVYEAVRESADAAFAIVRPGIRFAEVHDEAMKVIAAKISEWGFLDASADELLDADDQRHRRYMVHGTSHHLGIDVHDCAKARRELYREGVLEPGMVFTIEPGLYFQPDDLTVPEQYRGIGVRIEDDILVTEDGAENLSIAIPRTADDVEAWLARR